MDRVVVQPGQLRGAPATFAGNDFVLAALDLAHQDRLDYALQWQTHSGGDTSVFGALPERRGWQLSLRYYF